MITLDSTNKTLLEGADQLCMVDLVTITTRSGVVLHQTLGDVDLYVGGIYYDSNLKMTRERTRLVAGAEVDTLNVTIYPEPTNYIGGVPLSQAARAGILDGATFLLERAFFIPDWSQYRFKLIRFSGTVSDISDFTRSEIPLSVTSDLQVLNVMMPRDVYQPGCRRVLYGQGCELIRVLFSTPVTVAAGTTSNHLVGTLGGPAFPFTLGTITMETGENAGLSRTVKFYEAGVFDLISPLPKVPAIGDIFTAYAGCDKSQTTCKNVFNNIHRFSGEPYIPAAETAY
jgi:uncharacterized phage protein (TIGR02218 family)